MTILTALCTSPFALFVMLCLCSSGIVAIFHEDIFPFLEAVEAEIQKERREKEEERKRGGVEEEEGIENQETQPLPQIQVNIV